jgi:hypothetical protein
MKPNYRDFSLLKMLAVSVCHIVDPQQDRLCFIAPYIVQYKGVEPERLWLPEMDGVFKKFVEDVNGDRNMSLWKKFHEEGRKRDEGVSIWNYILTHMDNNVSGVEVDLIDDVEMNGDDEFIVGDNNINVLVATVYQSCGSLISVISLAALNDKNKKFTEQDKIKLKNYLEQVKDGRYINFISELNISTIGVDLWKNMRNEVAANHWGDSKDNYINFWCCKEDWANELKKDFDDDYENACVAGDYGRPSIQQVLTVNEGEAKLDDVIRRRISFILGDMKCVPKIIFDNTGNNDCWKYMWFNAMAVADSCAEAIRGYLAIRDGIKTDERIFVDDIYKKVKCDSLCMLTPTIYDDCKSIDLCVRIFEPGLTGKLQISRVGSDINRILSPATIAGAHELYITYLNGEKDEQQTDKVVKKDRVQVEESVGRCDGCRNSLLFTGICYKLKGRWNSDVAAYCITALEE